MGNRKRKGIVMSGLAVLGVGFFAAIFMVLGPPRLLAKSEAPAFCAGCHVMEAEYDAWSHAGAHRREMCVDCHLPNQNKTIHYIWKSIDGMKDTVAFYSGRVPERINIKPRSGGGAAQLYPLPREHRCPHRQGAPLLAMPSPGCPSRKRSDADTVKNV